MSTTGNRNTAQQQGESTNPFKGISSMYNAHLQHKDRVASLQQREDHFQKTFKQRADQHQEKLNQREDHFTKKQEQQQQQFNATQELKNKKYDLDVNKHNLNVAKTNHKIEKDQNDFKQRQKEHEDQMGIERAKVAISDNNSKIFEKDAAGKNVTRNLHNQILANQYNDGKKKKDQVKVEKAPIPTIHRAGPTITKGRNFTPTWKQGKVKTYTPPKTKATKTKTTTKATTGKTTKTATKTATGKTAKTATKTAKQTATKTAKAAGPVVPSGKNIKGSHGNRKKGL